MIVLNGKDASQSLHISLLVPYSIVTISPGKLPRSTENISVKRYALLGKS